MVATAADGEPGPVTEVLVTDQDTEGRLFPGGLTGLAMEVRGTNAEAETEVTNLGGGSHALRYTPVSLGFDTLDVTLAGEPVPGSPFASRVRLVLLAEVGTPTLDGVMGEGEWDDAPVYDVFSGPLEGSTVRFLTDGNDIRNEPDPAERRIRPVERRLGAPSFQDSPDLRRSHLRATSAIRPLASSPDVAPEAIFTGASSPLILPGVMFTRSI